MDNSTAASNTEKFLDFLGRAEGAGYDTITGGGKFTDFSRHPNKVGVVTKDGASTAAGLLQITKPTYDEFAPKLGITDFSPDSQRKIGKAIIEQAGALGDVESGNFTSAIGKLGGRWASLPSSKYGQAKRSWDWVGKNLDGASPPVPTSAQFTSATDSPLSASPSASQLYKDAKQREDEYGGVWNNAANLPAAVGLGFKVDNSVYNYFQDKGISQVDPDFRWNDDNSKRFLDGVPQRNWGYILQAKSEAEATMRKSRMVDTMEKEAELGRMGIAGFSGRLVGSLVDLPTLVSFVPGMAGEGLLTAGSRIANAARMGVFSAGFNVASEAASLKYRPTATTDNLYTAAAMGLGLGAAIGGAINPAKLAASRLARENAALGDFGRAKAVEAQRAELHGLAGTAGLDAARMDAHLPTKKGDATVDINAKVEAGQAAGAVEDVVTRIRDEVVPPRDPSVPDVPVFDRTGKAPSSPRGTGETTTAKATLAELKGSEDPMIAGLAERLEGQLADDVPIRMQAADFRSHYSTNGHEINLRTGAPDSVKLHEIAHAVTANKIRYGLANPESAHGVLTKELQDVFKEVKAAAAGEKFTDSKSNYYLKNLDEFVAGIYSGKGEFIDFLAKTKTGDDQAHSFLSKAVDVIRKILGMGPEEVNALTKALGITDQLIDTPLAVRQTLVSPRSGKVKVKEYHMEAPEGSPVDAATVTAAGTAEIPTVFGWGLGLENRLGGAKAAPEVRELASKLFGTTIGYKDHSVVKANAWDDTTKWAESWAVEMRKGTYPAFEEWLKKQDLPIHKKGEAFEDFGSQVTDYIRGFEKDFPPEVVKAGEQMRKTLAKAVDYINNPLLDEGLVKRGLTEVEIRDVETGAVEMVGKLEKNPNYLPRKHDINKWNDMATSFGRDAVEGWWARAYSAGRAGVSEEAAGKWAKWYVRTVEEAHANRSQDLLEDMMRGTDKDALKNSLIMNGGYDERGAQAIMDDMFPTKPGDAGRMASLKHRNTIDEKHTESWTRSDGTNVEVGLSDFTHSNAFDLVEPYLRRTAGSVALAKHLDIYKTGHIDNAILDATTNKLGAEFKNPVELAKYRKDLKFAFDRVQGLPQEEFTTLNKSMEMWRNFNVIRLMGGAVWNQATELSQVVGSMGWKATLGAIPELRGLRRDIATGKAPNDILDHLENTIGGVGSEYVARLDFKVSDDWVRHKGDTAFNRKLDAIDGAQKKLAKGVLDYTGMTPLMIQQKRIHAVALVNHWVNTAKGAESKFLTADRLAWMGMGEGDYKNVLKAIDTYTTPKAGEFSKSHSMDFEGWAKDSPETYSKFMTAIHRESRRVVQENDLSSMIPLMGTTLGKTVFQFMNFTMHGWNKSMLFAMNHRDFSTFSVMMQGGLMASLAYMGRTMLGAQGMSEDKKQPYLDKRMTAGQIVANGFGRIAQVSLLPVAFDTISPVPMFSGMRTTSDLSSMASNPTYQAINGLISMKKLIRNGASDQYQTTEKDIRTWGKLLPLNNVVPISTMLNSLANDYPHSETQH